MLVTVPPAVVIDTTPVTAPGITIAVTAIPESETIIAVTAPIVNVVILSKFVPVIFTNVPTDPESGVKVSMVGVTAALVNEKT